jgi:ATPase subunit of ABC transporter with duplicated ATPase domains
VFVSELAFAHHRGENLFFGTSFHISSSEYMALIGNYDVGQSTLLRILDRDLLPDEGKFSLEASVG